MTFGPCCTGTCCGPGSYCCANAGPHEHNESRVDAAAAEIHDRLDKLVGLQS